MNTTLRRIANQPHGDLALAAFLRFRTLVTPGLMSAENLESHLVASASNIAAADALAAIRRGFRAAERKPS